jgi:hypothetical protein
MSTIPGDDWVSVLVRPQAIRSVYANAPLFSVVYECLLHRDGPRLELKVDLDRFADFPPARWDKSFNQVQVTLRFDGLMEIDVQRWGWNGVLAEGAIVKRGRDVVFRFAGPEVFIRGIAESVDVRGVEGYCASQGELTSRS